MAVIRGVILAFAIVVCAWFVLGAVEAHQIDHVADVLAQSSSLTPAQSRAALDQLSSAGALNPDRQVDLLRAAVLQDDNRIKGSQAILLHVVAGEPMYVEAWYQLAGVAGADPSLERRALVHIAQLVPSLRPKRPKS
jgi:hypothetical protein